MHSSTAAHGSVDASEIDAATRRLRAMLGPTTPRVADLARATGVSVRSLQRRLEAQGLTFSALLTRVRFDEATLLLQCTDLPIAEIGRRLGYADPAHFTRAFNRVYGTNPHAVRGARQHAILRYGRARH
ncbi:MAG: helix-turn-helix transcriptional regulator [Pseudomonadota bacterium]